MKIALDDLTQPEIHVLLNEHLQSMYELSPPESVHALDLEKLRKPEITFWSAWEDSLLLGCGALKELDRTHGEIKSMRTPSKYRGRGAAKAVLARIVEAAKERDYRLLSLETGSHSAFAAAQSLYKSVGFQLSGPFAGYKEDPHSVFMELRLHGAA